MTFNGHYALYYITCLSFGAHHKNLNADRPMQIDPYCQRRKCSPVNVVFSDIRVIQIFAGVRELWGIKHFLWFGVRILVATWHKKLGCILNQNDLGGKTLSWQNQRNSSDCQVYWLAVYRADEYNKSCDWMQHLSDSVQLVWLEHVTVCSACE